MEHRHLAADPEKVHRFDHEGRFYRTRGPLPTPRSPQGRPTLFQAGSSPRGKDFAARWADAIFEIDPTPEGRRAYYDDVKSRASNAGRNPDDVLIFPSFIPFVGETAAIADFVDQVIPELQRRSLFREQYTGATLRENLGIGRG